MRISKFGLDTQPDQFFLLSRIFSVPVVQGVNDDTQFRSFIQKYFVGGSNSSTVDRIVAAYPIDNDFVSWDPPPLSTCSTHSFIQGSPFETSSIEYQEL